jgi:hypothetical protein
MNFKDWLHTGCTFAQPVYQAVTMAAEARSVKSVVDMHN